VGEVTYKIVPRVVFDVMRERRHEGEEDVILIATAPTERGALVIAQQLTLGEDANNEGDFIHNPVTEHSH
jgi:hypothetical protein